MRGKKALINVMAGMTYELVLAVCGFILPRLIMASFGSSYNGITSSIIQFLSCVVLLRSGVGAVTKASLYKSLANEDSDQINRTIRATEIFMQKVALIFCVCIIVFACIYPVFVRNEFGWLFSFSLVLIVGISTFVQNYFGVAYQLLLESDQRQGFINVIQICTTIANTVIAAIMIKLGFGIHAVKLGSALVFSMNPLIINHYVRKRYNLSRNVEPDFTQIHQRWDALAYQIANFVHNNTDVMVLTIFADVKIVSVYMVYYMVTNGLRSIVLIFVSGFSAAFGNMMAKGENKTVEENLKLYELIVFSLATIIFSTCAAMIVPFVSVYTAGIVDVDYVRGFFGLLLSLATLCSCYRIPYHSIVEASGRFRETRNGSILEAVLNISISILLVSKFGLIGVVIGTIIATIFRSVQYAVFVSTNVVKRSLMLFAKRVFFSLITFISVVFIDKFLEFRPVITYFEWAYHVTIIVFIALIITVIINLLFYYPDVKRFLVKINLLTKQFFL